MLRECAPVTLIGQSVWQQHFNSGSPGLWLRRLPKRATIHRHWVMPESFLGSIYYLCHYSGYSMMRNNLAGPRMENGSQLCFCSIVRAAQPGLTMAQSERI